MAQIMRINTEYFRPLAGGGQEGIVYPIGRKTKTPLPQKEEAF